MLHAMDYANMDVVQLRRRMKEAKMKDKRMTTFVRYGHLTSPKKNVNNSHHLMITF